MSEALLELIKSKNTSKKIQQYAISLKKMDLVFSFRANTKIYRFFGEAYDLLVSHFLEAANLYQKLIPIQTTDAKKKRINLEKEIDLAIALFQQMIENATRSIWNANRLANPINPGLASIAYVAPRLYEYYSDMLNQLANSYTLSELGQEDCYAFCVNSTTENTNRMRVLFENRSKHGKVCLIFIPEKTIAQIRDNQFILLHEFHHVLPIHARERDERQQLMDEILFTLLSNGLATNPEQRLVFRYILEYYGEIVSKKIKPLQEKNEYGSQTIQFMITKWGQALEWINSDAANNHGLKWARILKERRALISEESGNWDILTDYMSQDKFDSDYDRLMKRIIEMKNYHFVYIVERLMDIFKEGFADLMTILVIGLSPKAYFEIIQSKLREPLLNSIYDEVTLKLRCIYVVLSLNQIANKENEAGLSEEFCKSWKEDIWNQAEMEESGGGLVFRLCKQMREQLFSSYEEKNCGRLWEMLLSDETIRGKICTYFCTCARTWLQLQRSNEDFYVRFNETYSLAGSLKLNKRIVPVEETQLLLRITEKNY